VFDIVKRTARGTARLQLHGDVQVAPGTGPRHLAFAPDGRHCYVLGELSDDVLAYDYDDGRLGLLQTLNAALRPAHGGGDIHIDPSGRYLYASVRLVDDGIAIYKIGPDGRLTRAGYQLTGRHPRNFMITPDGRLLLCACRDDNVIQLYSIDPATGLLTCLGRDLHVSKPVCIKLVP
jgi:6-phosphogluconolactonase (cycloisomerase 2 family)